LVKIIESPRDAWQHLPKPISAEVKAEYLRQLLLAGFTHLDAASFVSPDAVPQMADSELVLEFLDAPPGIEVIGLVANARGAQRAVESGRITTLAFPYSISPQFLERNQRQTPEEALDQLEQIGEIAYKGGQDVVAYLAMAFGNPFGDLWDIDEVVSAVDLLVDSGVAQVSLSDTAGLASVEQVRDVVACVAGVHEGLELGVHLRTRPEDASAKVRAAYAAGCRRFACSIGSSIAGLGASPLAHEAMLAGLPTETVLATLRELGAPLPEIDPLDRLIASSREIERRYSAVIQ